jgi:hypothetical protein
VKVPVTFRRRYVWANMTPNATALLEPGLPRPPGSAAPSGPAAAPRRQMTSAGYDTPTQGRSPLWTNCPALPYGAPRTIQIRTSIALEPFKGCDGHELACSSELDHRVIQGQLVRTWLRHIAV